MFTYVKLKNFKSFGNICFDFKKTQKETKKFIAIYGENGSGKSNFVSVFEFMYYSFNSIKLNDVYNLITVNAKELSIKVPQMPMNSILNQISMKLNDYRMIGCSEPTTVELGFEIDGIEGYYSVKFTDIILSEELYYLCGKKRGKIFSLNSDDKKVSSGSFSSDYMEDFEKALDKYWGKHTLFAILCREMNEKNPHYIESNVSKALLDVYYSLNKTFVSYTKYDLHVPLSGSGVESYSYDGILPIKDEKLLDTNEKILNELLVQLYPDIKCVYYEKKIKNDKIEYSLHAKKVIANAIRDIPFDYESTGTRGLLRVLSAAVAVMNGETVIYDEIDSGIHDLLMKTLITSLAKAASGQLIITTHNTLLLESIDSQSAYVIYMDCDGNKEARCIADYGDRVQKNNNMRNLYLKGMYGGIPYTSEIDFSYILNTIERAGDGNAE
ncbi:MAG: AAA family ATPase [Ruminococcaceae bacterium]|nr:AAA family ATPase [Oscillospiraceae bacterium]